jgi:hypothetical protein
MRALRWALDSGIVGQPFFAPRRLIDLYRSHLDRYGEHWRGGSERRAALPGQIGLRAGSSVRRRGGSWGNALDVTRYKCFEPGRVSCHADARSRRIARPAGPDSYAPPRRRRET